MKLRLVLRHLIALYSCHAFGTLHSFRTRTGVLQDSKIGSHASPPSTVISFETGANTEADIGTYSTTTTTTDNDNKNDNKSYIGNDAAIQSELSPKRTTGSIVASGEKKDDTKAATIAKQYNNSHDGYDDDENTFNNVFDLIAARTAAFILESDMKRHAVGLAPGTVAPSATKWIDDATASALQQAVDCLQLALPDQRKGMDRDEASHWIRFFKAIPTPVIVDLTRDFRQVVNATFPQHKLDSFVHHHNHYNNNNLNKRREEMLNRMACRMILLPSGATLPYPMVEFPHSLIYGKLLYGGVTRSRLLPSSSSSSSPTPATVRAAGVRTVSKTNWRHNVPGWIMFGGAMRTYQAVDMGPAAVFEVIVMPQDNVQNYWGDNPNMVLEGLPWPPQKMFDFHVADEHDATKNQPKDMNHQHQHDYYGKNRAGYSAWSLSGRERNEAFRKDFTSAVGGLQPQIDAIVRRVLDGRVIRPADTVPLSAEEKDRTNRNGISSPPALEDNASRDLSMVSLEAEELALLGLTPVKGLLLYGPPGCGKTALAREISRALKARAPKIVAAPELLDRWVGGSEKLVRSLFADAQAELASHNGDASKSALHVIVIDEIDAVFRKRSSSEDTGEATRASVVNQILSCLDGVNAIPNILLIGMTNRRELLDEALLRPGRLEVQIEIPLPDRQGRREILQIHFDALRQRGRLSMPLCCAIDGVAYNAGFLQSSVQQRERQQQQQHPKEDKEQSSNRFWDRFQRWTRKLPVRRRIYDLADATVGFSGADLAGLVRAAGSIALSRARRDGSGVSGLLITLEDVQQALLEVKEH